VDDILAPAMESVGFKLRKVDLNKKKQVFVENQLAMSFETFAEFVSNALRKNYREHQEIFDIAINEEKLGIWIDAVKDHARNMRCLVGDTIRPEALAEFQLNMDLESDPAKFFVTTKDEYLSRMTGAAYIAMMGMKQDEAVANARHVFMEYDPRGGKGVRTVKSSRESRQVFNTYVPPLWRGHADVKVKHPKIHPLFLKCIKHVFPIKVERQFFYAWLYASIFLRAPTYLILCGNAGLGKNRIKLLLRALHGHENTPDGKRSSLTERFNSQVERTTLLWFDELNFNEDVENILKEMQNETLSIERKGVDATRSTKIYSSMVISNNYPRNNYIQFDSRKFVPLELGATRLGASMTNKEIDALTKMTAFPDQKEFDVAALAQFVGWLKQNGPGLVDKFPNLEYKGPMFYRLAHTTMSRWQIAIIQFMTSPEKLKSAFVSDKKEFGAKWSTLEPQIRRLLSKGYQMPHTETIKRFLEIYCSLKGEQGFKVTPIKDSFSGDFYVKPLIKSMPKLEELAHTTSIDEDESDIDLL
jgi:hypothetical protein